MQLNDILQEKRHGKFTKVVLFLHNNAPPHRALATQKKLAYLGFQCLDHTPYSPDLAPVGLPPVLWTEKKQLRGRHFSSDAEVIAAAETWLDGQHSEFFLSGLQKLEQRAKSVLSFVGIMLNNSRVWSLWLVSFLVGLRTNQYPSYIRVCLLFLCASSGKLADAGVLSTVSERSFLNSPGASLLWKLSGCCRRNLSSGNETVHFFYFVAAKPALQSRCLKNNLSVRWYYVSMLF